MEHGGKDYPDKYGAISDKYELCVINSLDL